MTNTKTLMDRVLEIPGEDGFWKGATMSIYQKAASQLRELGMSDDAIIELLGNLYHSTADEFGG